MFPESIRLTNLLVRLAQSETSPLRASTIRVYKAEFLACLREGVEQGKAASRSAKVAGEEIVEALEKRRGRPADKRTASLKVKDARKEEVDAVMRYVHDRAKTQLGDERTQDGVLMTWLLIASRVGLRPIEWTTASVDKKRLWLTVNCAKATNGRGCAKVRRVYLGGLPESVRLGVAAFCHTFPKALRLFKGDWRKLRGALAERLARACKACGVRRLSLYSFRHIAIATWKAAGMDKAMIAALAGHAVTDTQTTYAPRKSGWKLRATVTPEPALVDSIALRSGLAGPPAGALEENDDVTMDAQPAFEDDLDADAEPGEDTAFDPLDLERWLNLAGEIAAGEIEVEPGDVD